MASDANITAYWGNANAGMPSYANDGSVWDGYFGVYHLEGGTGNAVDSSPFGNDLPGVNSPVVVASGMSGRSFSVTQAANNGFLSNSLTGNIKAKEGTYIAWIQNNPSATSDANKDFWGIGYNNDPTHFGKMEFGTNDKDHARFRVTGGTTGFGGFNSTNISLNGGWKMLTLVIKDGYATTYVDTSTDTSSLWYHPGLDSITGLSIGRGIDDAGPSTTFDEATFSTVARSAAWISASYNNQKPDQSSNPYLNFGSLDGPISLNDQPYTKIYGRKDANVTAFQIGFSGSGSFEAVGLPVGMSLNVATGQMIYDGSTVQIQGTPSQETTQNITINAEGTTAGGTIVSVSKIYTVIITDPSSFPFRMDLTLSGYTGSSTLTDFPVLIELNSSISGFSYNGFLDSDGDGVRTGGDLRFFAASGQELAYEIADWNTSGQSDIWVKVPSVSGTNTIITTAWGKSGTETTPDYASSDPVWSNEYHAVWHLNDITTGNFVSDSGMHSYHGQVFGGAVNQAGLVGDGLFFDGTNDYVSFGVDAGNPGTASFTTSF